MWPHGGVSWTWWSWYCHDDESWRGRRKRRALPAQGAAVTNAKASVAGQSPARDHAGEPPNRAAALSAYARAGAEGLAAALAPLLHSFNKAICATTLSKEKQKGLKLQARHALCRAILSDETSLRLCLARDWNGLTARIRPMFIEGLSKDAGDDLLSKVYTRLSDYETLPRDKDAILGDLLRAHRACESYGASAALGRAELVLVSMMAEVWRCEWLSQPSTAAVLIEPLDAALRRHGLSEEAAMRLTHDILTHLAPPVRNHHADEWATSDSDASPAVEDSSLADDGATTQEATSTTLQQAADEGGGVTWRFVLMVNEHSHGLLLQHCSNQQTKGQLELATSEAGSEQWRLLRQLCSKQQTNGQLELATSGAGSKQLNIVSSGNVELDSISANIPATSTTLQQTADEGSTGAGHFGSWEQAVEDRAYGDIMATQAWSTLGWACQGAYAAPAFAVMPIQGLQTTALISGQQWPIWSEMAATTPVAWTLGQPLVEGQVPCLPMSEMDSFCSSVQSSIVSAQGQPCGGQLHFVGGGPQAGGAFFNGCWPGDVPPASHSQAVESFFPLSSCSASPASTTPGCSDPAAKGNLPQGGEDPGGSDTVTATTESAGPSQMADNSFAWAAAKGLLRMNEVHKTEEAKLVVEEKFSNKSERGVVDPEMAAIARLGHGNYHNASRALHKFVHREGKTLPIPISTTPLTVRKKRGGSIDVKYPILRLTDWLKHILGEAGGQFVLAGHHVWDTGYQDVFRRFWERYESADSQHVIYSKKNEQERSRTIPICIHGDEGRGLAKVPVLITNFQCLVKGKEEVFFVALVAAKGSVTCVLEMKPRQTQYPTGCGKAYDVALLSKWLEAKLLVIKGEQGDALRVQFSLSCDMNEGLNLLLWLFSNANECMSLLYSHGAEAVAMLVAELLRTEHIQSLAVIAPYAAQRNLLERRLSGLGVRHPRRGRDFLRDAQQRHRSHRLPERPSTSKCPFDPRTPCPLRGG
eukprot:s2157_g5.t3